MQTDSQIGSYKGFNELGSKADAMLQNQSRLGVESSALSSAAKIKTAHGITAAAKVDARAAGAQMGATMASMAEADKEYAGKGGYEGYMRDNAIAQTGTAARTMKNVGGPKAMIETNAAAQTKQFDSTKATLAADEHKGLINSSGHLTQNGFNAVKYAEEVKAQSMLSEYSAAQSQGLADKKGNLTELGDRGIQTDALQKSIASLKSASLNNKAASFLASALDGLKDPADRAQTQKAYGLSDHDVKDIMSGKGLSQEGLSNFLKNNEKKIEQFHLAAFDGTGRVASVSMNQIASGVNKDGSLSYTSSIQNMSSFQKVESGKSQNDHLAETVGAEAKEAVNSVGGYGVLHTAEAIGVAGGLGWAANGVYGKVTGAKSFAETPLGRIGEKLNELGKRFSPNSFDKPDGTNNHSQPQEPHGTQNNITEHGTPPKTVNEQLGMKSTPHEQSIPHPQTVSSSGGSYKAALGKIGAMLGLGAVASNAAEIGQTAMAAVTPVQSAVAGTEMGNPEQLTASYRQAAQHMSPQQLFSNQPRER